MRRRESRICKEKKRRKEPRMEWNGIRGCSGACEEDLEVQRRVKKIWIGY